MPLHSLSLSKLPPGNRAPQGSHQPSRIGMMFKRHVPNLGKMNKITKKIVKMGVKFKAVYYDTRLLDIPASSFFSFDMPSFEKGKKKPKTTTKQQKKPNPKPVSN